MESRTIADPDLAPAASRTLLALARDAVEASVRAGANPVAPRTPSLGVCRGAFVSLEVKGRLRGCVGRVAPDRPLGPLIVRLAAAVCADPRFRNVGADELGELRLEVSVLGTPRRLQPADPAHIRLGSDGLIVQRPGASSLGVLLPRVAIDHGWTGAEFLAATCRKAGLPDQAWRHRDLEIFAFHVEVIGE